MMRVSKKGLLEIAEHEGIVLGPYLDSVGVWTYGVGHTAAAGGPDPSTMKKTDTSQWDSKQVEEELLKILNLFTADLDKYATRVNDAIVVPLRQHEFDALVSFDLNTGGIYRANLTKQINSGDKTGDGFMGWLKPKEIIKRRKAEQALFRTGNYDSNGSSIPVYDAYPNGRIKYRAAMGSKELLSLLDKTSKPSVTTKNNTSIIGIILGLAKKFFKKP